MDLWYCGNYWLYHQGKTRYKSQYTKDLSDNTGVDSKAESHPRTDSHHKDEAKQKAHTELEMRDYWNEIRKLESQKRTIMRTLGEKEYVKRRNDIALKYNLSRKEQLTHLGITDRDSK